MLKRVSRSQQNCPSQTYFSKLSTEDMLVSVFVDTASYFLLPISQLHWIESFSRKSVLPRHAKRVSDSIGAASTLLASASAPSSIRRGLGRRSVWASFWCGACRAHQGIALRVYKLVSSTLLLLALRGSWEELIANNGRRAVFY